MKKFTLLILSHLLAAGALAASHTAATTPEVQRPTSPKSEAAAEARHGARVHGIDKSASQPQVQMPTESKSAAAAEARNNAKPRGVNVVQSIPLENGSTVLIFQDGKMGMEDKMGKSTRMKPGHVMKAKDGTELMMVGDEVMRVERLRKESKGGN